MNAPDLCYAGYRFPSEIISHAVWLYYRAPQQAVEKMTLDVSPTLTTSTLDVSRLGWFEAGS